MNTAFASTAKPLPVDDGLRLVRFDHHFKARPRRHEGHGQHTAGFIGGTMLIAALVGKKAIKSVISKSALFACKSTVRITAMVIK